ncbi:hypothetical protein Krac_10261 [Ktedonobacter racemifer DSM 44963]|uniref:Uncharacterized protein n=1 Tax=Ktedonobacter racemifer DSM 44963 TaxID=485913 RepID=D6TG61_KTERA|nr:hypothetical protein Krac_10261 [Ktedonobacter racemifer DSM 44963]
MQTPSCACYSGMRFVLFARQLYQSMLYILRLQLLNSSLTHQHASFDT